MPAKQQPAAVVGRRVGGGFEIESVRIAQEEEAARYRARLEIMARVQASHLQQQRSEEAELRRRQASDSSPQQETAKPASAAGPAALPEASHYVPILPNAKLHKHVAKLEVLPEDVKRQQRRRQECQALGFPVLWSYSQTQMICEEISRGISEMAFAPGGQRLFSSPAVMQTYKDMNLSFLHDPLLAPMLARIAHRQAMGTSSDESENAGAEGGKEEADEDDDRLGVERLALPPHQLRSVDPTSPPVSMPTMEAVETILAFAQLSTHAERRGMRPAALSRLHQRRAAELFALVLPESAVKVVNHSLKPKLATSSSGVDRTASTGGTDSIVNGPNSATSAAACAVRDAVQILFWYVFAAFFHHDLLRDLTHYFLPLSQAMLSLQMLAMEMRSQRLAPTGDPNPNTSSVVGVVEHPDHNPTALDFIPFVLVHTVCFLFPEVFPASHDLFTVDFFCRASMLMNIILCGTETDAAFWTATRHHFFSAAEISVEEVANAAVVARTESDRLLQKYHDDVANMRKLRLQHEQRQQARVSESFKRIRGDASGYGDASYKDLRPQPGHRTNSHVRSSALYCPPLDSIELGDATFHLLNDDIFDAEYAQELTREREMQFKHRALDSSALVFEPQSQEEAGEYRAALEGRKFRGHAASLQTALALEMKERFHPSAYSTELRKEQAILDRDIRAAKRRLTSDDSGSEATEDVEFSVYDADAAASDDPSMEPTADNYSGLVVRFTAKGIHCSKSAEGLARSFRQICMHHRQRQLAANSSSKLSSSVSPLDMAPGSRALVPADHYFNVQVALLNGSPTVMDASSVVDRVRNRDVPTLNRDASSPSDLPPISAMMSDVKPSRKLDTLTATGDLAGGVAESPTASVTFDPVIESAVSFVQRDDGTADLTSPTARDSNFGEVIFGKMRRSFVGSHKLNVGGAGGGGRGAEAPEDDLEAKEAVASLAESLFAHGAAAKFEPGAYDAVSVSGDSQVPGTVSASHAPAVARMRTFRGKTMLLKSNAEEALGESHGDLAVTSFLSLKRHESVCHRQVGMVLRGEHEHRSQQQHSPTEGNHAALTATGTAVHGRSPPRDHDNESFARKPSAHRQSTSTSPNHLGSASDRFRLAPPSRSASATLLLSRCELGSGTRDRSPPRESASTVRRAATPASRPHGTIVVGVNASEGTPSLVHVRPTRTEKTSSLWLNMTQTVKRTQKYIDDAVRIHNAQDKLKDLLEAQKERQRGHAELRQRAMDKAFEDEMTDLHRRIAEPLQRTMLVNEWIAREPARRWPDRDKHAAMLKGTLLAEEAQHTSLMVREGLKNLEHMFARRRRQTRKR